jgi:hypothetical protein
MKLMLPMAENQGRDYAVTELEQQDLARRYGLQLGEVRVRLKELREKMLSGDPAPQKTGNKTRLIIAVHFESSNAIGRQGA